jgi:hypothetical protein
MDQVFAPFTPEQVVRIKQYQEALGHPLTCCGEVCSSSKELDYGTLKPTEAGLICPCGKQTQTWVPALLVDDYAPMPDIPGKSLYKRVLDLLRVAKDKGYPKYIEYYDPLEIKSWRHDEQEFCAVVCAVLQLWLQRTHDIAAWVEPIAPGRYGCGIHSADFTWWSVALYPAGEYYDMFIKGIDFALNNLIDGTARANPTKENPGDAEAGNVQGV